MERYSTPETIIQEILYETDQTIAFDRNHATLQVTKLHAQQLSQLRQELQSILSAEAGFSSISRINFTDRVRVIFANGDVAHIRPSGNADELRIYSVSNSQERVDAITRLGIAEPDGPLRRLERMV